MLLSIVLAAGIILLFLIAVIGWFLLRDSGHSASTDVKTQRIEQTFCSNDLKKRAFVIRQNDGQYKVVFQHYRIGDVEGWQALPKKPVTDTLASAVEIAQGWTHAEN